MSNAHVNLDEKKAMAKRTNRKRVRVSERVILAISGKGILKSWVVVRIPTSLAIGVLICFLTLAIALALSPDIAAQFAFALIQLARLISQPTK